MEEHKTAECGTNAVTHPDANKSQLLLLSNKLGEKVVLSIIDLPRLQLHKGFKYFVNLN